MRISAGHGGGLSVGMVDWTETDADADADAGAAWVPIAAEGRIERD